MELKYYKTSLVSRTQLAHDVYEVIFNKPQNFNFLAGQFTQFQIPDNDNHVLRSYSIASAPHDENLYFVIKIIPNGKASTFFLNLTNEKELKLSEAVSKYNCDQTPPLLLISTGTGLAPNISMARDQLEKKNNTNNIKILFGVRYEEDIFYQDKLEKLIKKYNNFTYTLALSRPHDNWDGDKGRLTEHLPKVIEKDQQIYICGMTEMVQSIRQELLARGANATNIHFEIF